MRGDLKPMRTWSDNPASVRPMLATSSAVPLPRGPLAYEPKYDGIRAIVSIEPASAPGGHGGQRRSDPGAPPMVGIWSRLGNEKTAQFPGIAARLRAWGGSLSRPLLLDGEIVALDRAGAPLGFQRLQRRAQYATGHESEAGVAFIAFDLLRDGDEDLRPLPLDKRRARLEAVLSGLGDPQIRISEQTTDGPAMQQRAMREGWEGLLAKRLDSPYRSGRRSTDWRKLKLVRHQTAVVAGWTEPRGSRPFFGALLLGVYDDEGRLRYVGHAGSGFTDAELERVWSRLAPLRTDTCPFDEAPPTNERPHWVEPRLTAEVKFTEWTEDGRLRHPTYLGLRDDTRPETVRREPDVVVSAVPRAMPIPTPPGRPKPTGEGGKPAGAGGTHEARFSSMKEPLVGADPGKSLAPAKPRSKARSHSAEAAPGARAAVPKAAEIGALLDQLGRIEEAGGGGVLELPGGARLEVSNLRKRFWPTLKLTKGDLFRHYVRVAPYLLPVLEDRPLVMKRYPNGVSGKPFYQHRAPERPPAGVRVETIDGGGGRRPHIVGGDLITLLYTAQLASISQDPWFSRVGSDDEVDHVAIDLDPPEHLPFHKVLDVARWVRDELDALGSPAFAKTSGSRGLHVYVPMPPRTPYEAGLIFCQIVATLVVRKHPKETTIARAVGARGRRVYLDCLQNMRGKTLASAYSVRANDVAGVSTPVAWAEVDAGISPQDFTLSSFAARLQAVGDLWAGLRESPPASLTAVMNYGGTGRARR
jgi:bifunctional non-homologous end joining protein LigD